MQQYYLSTIYILLEYEYISLAIIRSASLRLQNEGQKKLTDCTDAHGVFDTDFFDLCLLMQKDSKRICKRYRLRLVLDHESPESHEYIPCHDLQDSSDSCD